LSSESSENSESSESSEIESLMDILQECPFTGDHWPQYWTTSNALCVSKLSLEQRNDLFRYFYEHGKHYASGASQHEAFKAYNGYSLRMVAEYFGVNASNLKRNVERSPLYQAYVAASAVSDEGSKFRWHDQSAQVMDKQRRQSEHYSAGI
jgi:hypothetical protein